MVHSAGFRRLLHDFRHNHTIRNSSLGRDDPGDSPLVTILISSRPAGELLVRRDKQCVIAVRGGILLPRSEHEITGTLHHSSLPRNEFWSSWSQVSSKGPWRSRLNRKAALTIRASVSYGMFLVDPHRSPTRIAFCCTNSNQNSSTNQDMDISGFQRETATILRDTTVHVKSVDISCLTVSTIVTALDPWSLSQVNVYFGTKPRRKTSESATLAEVRVPCAKQMSALAAYVPVSPPREVRFNLPSSIQHMKFDCCQKSFS